MRAPVQAKMLTLIFFSTTTTSMISKSTEFLRVLAAPCGPYQSRPLKPCGAPLEAYMITLIMIFTVTTRRCMFSKCTKFLRFLDGLVVPTSAAVLILRAHLQANMLTLIFPLHHYNNGCMFSKSTEFLQFSILRAALEAKC